MECILQSAHIHSAITQLKKKKNKIQKCPCVPGVHVDIVFLVHKAVDWGKGGIKYN